MKKILLQNKQFILYSLIGISSITLDIVVYSLLIKAKLFEYQAANAVGYTCGTILSFFLNAKFNFRVTDKLALRLASFFGVAFVGWLASAACLYLLISHFGFDKYLSKAATLLVVVLLQYNMNRLISFRKKN